MKSAALKRGSPSKRRKRPMAARRRGAKGSLAWQCDAVWRRLVKAAWGHTCAVCGATCDLESHHLIGRGHMRTRYELRNGMCLCRYHHRCAQGRAKAFQAWLLAANPALVTWVETNRNGTVTATEAWYREQLQRLRELESEA